MIAITILMILKKKNDYNHDEINHILFARQYIKGWMSSGN